MQIDEALRIARTHARRIINAERWRAHAIGRELPRTSRLQEAMAVHDVCDALEAFLKKQEEDNSYHTKG